MTVKDNDYAFTVTAHEVAHQWWGHQVAPSATRGANQISETMAEYASLMVTKQQYGEASMGKFLKYELDNVTCGSRSQVKASSRKPCSTTTTQAIRLVP